MRPVMAGVSHGLAGKRDRRMLARHVRHCRSCRQDAVELGLEAFVSDSRRNGARNTLSRAASFLPLPFLRRRLLDEPADPSSGISAASAQAHIAHLGTVAGASAEQTASVLQKAVALAAVAAVASGGGIVAHKVGVGVPLPKISASEKKATPQAAAPLDPSTPARVGDRSPANGSGGDRGGGAHPAAGGGSIPVGTNLPTTSTPAAGEGQPGAPSSGTRTPGPAGPLGAADPLADGLILPPSDSDVPASDSAPGKDKTDKPKKDSPGNGPPPPAGSGLPASGGGYEPPRGIEQRIEKGGTIPPGIQKKLDEAAAEQPDVTLP
jgi:hypothetical protein